MRVISLLNFKGGTGKTTTVVNLGMGLALRGHSVLAIDLDPQGGVGTWLGVDLTHTTSDLLLGTTPWQRCVVRSRTRFDVIPSDRRLADAERTLTQSGAEPGLLARRLEGIELAGYDYILLDCAPSIDILSECALAYSREVFVPISMEYLALVGARMVIIEVLRARRLLNGKSARVSLVVPCFYDERFSKSDETMHILEQHFPGMVSSPIRLSERLSQAPSHRLTIFELDPQDSGSLDFARLAERVASHIATDAITSVPPLAE